MMLASGNEQLLFCIKSRMCSLQFLLYVHSMISGTPVRPTHSFHDCEPAVQPAYSFSHFMWLVAAFSQALPTEALFSFVYQNDVAPISLMCYSHSWHTCSIFWVYYFWRVHCHWQYSLSRCSFLEAATFNLSVMHHLSILICIFKSNIMSNVSYSSIRNQYLENKSLSLRDLISYSSVSHMMWPFLLNYCLLLSILFIYRTRRMVI